MTSVESQKTIGAVDPESLSPELRPERLPILGPNPLVSVLIANHNYGQYLGESIRSILRQTYQNFEVIVCDDGSTDSSRDIARSFATADNRVRLLTKSNGGQASAMNAAFADSRGEIICLLDSDDAFEPEKLELMVRVFYGEMQTGLVVHPMVVVDDAGVEIQRLPFIGTFEQGWLAPRVMRRGGRWRFMPTSCVAFRRELGRFCMPIPERTFRTCADAFIFTLLPLVTHVGYVDDVLCRYRIHGANVVGARSVDSHTVGSNLNSLIHTLDAVNERLKELGIPVQLEADRNVYIRLESYKLSLLQGKALAELLPSYWHLAAAIAADDLLRRRHKLALLVVNAIAILVPTRLRAWLLTRVSAPNKAKYRMQKLLAALRRISRRRFSRCWGQEQAVSGIAPE
jgi:glycosyltransferase involved in cell wall biosynthesis